RSARVPVQCRRYIPQGHAMTMTSNASDTANTTADHAAASSERRANLNLHVARWIDECVALCQPDRLHWCTGSADERRALFEQGVADGVFIRLNQQTLPGCYLHRSNANDVARSEQLTFICTPGPDMAG